jgi:sucrose-6-phosphate hydrolase SacC (GH32 family)
MSKAHCILISLLCLTGWAWSAAGATLLFSGSGETQSGVHGKGNVYAPDVHFYDGKYWIWFGGQGRDGHDRIHLAQSNDGKAWKQLGVVLDNGSANHVNDPSLVRAKGEWWMFYTVALVDVVDEIALATSRDGVHWKKRQTVLAPSEPPGWDSLLVGRPSVLHENGVFKMWYDGCKDLPLNAPAKNVPKSASSQRFVGYAESKDGLKWERKSAAPTFNQATAAHVSRVGAGSVMVYESHAGTQFATSKDGMTWQRGGLLAEKSSDFDKFGHVTPFLFSGKNGKPTLYFGAAREGTWDVNCMGMVMVSDGMIEKIKAEGLK